MTITTDLRETEGFCDEAQIYFKPDVKQVTSGASSIRDCYLRHSGKDRDIKLFFTSAELHILRHYYFNDGPKTYVTILIADDFDLANLLFGLKQKLPDYERFACLLPQWPDATRFNNDDEVTNFHNCNCMRFKMDCFYQFVVEGRRYLAITHSFDNISEN